MEGHGIMMTEQQKSSRWYRNTLERNQRVRRERRAEAIIAFGGKCVKCGSVDRLEFDHIDPNTKITKDFWLSNPDLRNKELAKCQLLCRGCHVKKSSVENRRPLPRHGCMARYYRGCRCDNCKLVASKHKYDKRLGDIKKHGVLTGYSYGCRCQKCLDAYRSYTDSRKAKRLNEIALIKSKYDHLVQYAQSVRTLLDKIELLLDELNTQVRCP